MEISEIRFLENILSKGLECWQKELKLEAIKSFRRAIKIDLEYTMDYLGYMNIYSELKTFINSNEKKKKKNLKHSKLAEYYKIKKQKKTGRFKIKRKKSWKELLLEFRIRDAVKKIGNLNLKDTNSFTSIQK